jgi:hypothetical protein
VPATLCNENVINPTVTIRNNGTVTLTSLTLTYQVTGGGPATSNWTGSLASGAQTNHALPAITLPNGEVTLTVTASLPNGQADENPANDTRTQDVLVASPGASVIFNLTLDNYGSETTWALATEGGATVATGGPYQNGQNGTVVPVQWCLPLGCYVLTVFDDYGDGICCQYGQGSFQVLGPEGAVLVSNNGQFTSSAVEPFCVLSVGVDEVAAPMDFTLAPNPTDGLLNVWLPTGLQEAGHLVVLDAVGRVVASQQLAQGEERTEIDLSSSGAGLYFVELVMGQSRSVKRVVVTR